ncbi:MAG: nuclear transport factor 2 family protein, partial [Gemmatimonadota bacterium]
MNRTESVPRAAFAPRASSAPRAARLFRLCGMRDVLPQAAALLAAALLAGAPLAATLLAAQDVGRPEDVVRAFHDALATGDSALVLTLLAENVVIFESGGVEASRAEYRSHHLPADIAFARSTEKEVTVDRVGFSGDVAWVLSHSTTT